MKGTQTHRIRALLLAGIVTTWIVAGSFGFAGGAVAQSAYQLEASDGASGTSSALYANVDDQLPQGNQSGDDTLRVEATNEPLPRDFSGDLSLTESSDLAFNTSQNRSHVELVVIGEDGSTATADDDSEISVTGISRDRLEFQVSYDEGNVFGETEDPVAVEVSNLTFDAGSSENAQLTWHIPNEETQYDLVVEDRDVDLTATDENGGDAAKLTAGAADQTMAGSRGTFDTDPASNLVLQADEEDFPSEFQVTATVGHDRVTFNGSLNESDIDASTSNEGADVTVDRVAPDEISVTVSNFDGTAEDAVIVELAGVTYDVPADSSGDQVTWRTMDGSDSYRLEAEYLAASFEQDSYEITRGLDGQPSGGAAVTISADGRVTDGFHGQSNALHVTIPPDRRDELRFDTTSQPEASMIGDGDVDASVEDEYLLELSNFPDDVDSGDTVTVSGITFNTTGYGPADEGDASFESGLDLEYEPVDNGAQDRVSIETGTEALDVRVPAISFENGAPTHLEPGATRTAGDTAIEVNVTDTSGGQMANGTDIVIGLENANGLEFDESQEDELQLRENASFYAAVDITVDNNQIFISIPEFAESSQEGESVILEHEDGDGIRFDASDAAVGKATLRVRTNASDAPVTQETGEAIVVGDPDPQESPDDGSGDGGGDGDGDGDGDTATPEGDADFRVTGTTINETSIDVDEAVAVTATIENTGDADGEFTVRLTADGFTLASETVAVPHGETREVTLVDTFGQRGSYDLQINDDIEVATLQVGAEGAAVVATETVALEDQAPGESGLRVGFEAVPVRSITFSEGSGTGEVTVEQHSQVPRDAATPDDPVFEVVTIDVPSDLASTPATVEIAVSAGDLEAADVTAEDLRILHYDESAGAWTELETEVVEPGGDEVVLAAETPGFSTFAVTAHQDEPATTETDDPTATATTTAEPLEEQSGIPNPMVLGGIVLVLVVLSVAAAVGKRLYEDGGL